MYICACMQSKTRGYLRSSCPRYKGGIEALVSLYRASVTLRRRCKRYFALRGRRAFFRGFENGLGDRRGWHRENLRMPGNRSSFLHPFSYAPSGEEDRILGWNFCFPLGLLKKSPRQSPDPKVNLCALDFCLSFASLKKRGLHRCKMSVTGCRMVQKTLGRLLLPGPKGLLHPLLRTFGDLPLSCPFLEPSDCHSSPKPTPEVH